MAALQMEFEEMNAALRQRKSYERLQREWNCCIAGGGASGNVGQADGGNNGLFLRDIDVQTDIAMEEMGRKKDLDANDAARAIDEGNGLERIALEKEIAALQEQVALLNAECAMYKVRR